MWYEEDIAPEWWWSSDCGLFSGREEVVVVEVERRSCCAEKNSKVVRVLYANVEAKDVSKLWSVHQS